MEKNYIIRIPNEDMGYDDYGLYKTQKLQNEDKTILKNLIYINKEIIKEIIVYLDKSTGYCSSIINRYVNGIKITLIAKRKDNLLTLEVNNGKNSYIKRINFTGKIVDIYQLVDYISSLDLQNISTENITILDLENGLITYCSIQIKKCNQNYFMLYLVNDEEVYLVFEIQFVKEHEYSIKRMITSGYILNVI